ncbi:MAG TPA: aspartyl protease family protein [Bryobacteraceae bacterium]|nr:aspartyl protease family protein [Bryobacteraceae bacterium]
MRRWLLLCLSALAVATAADNLEDARAQLLAGHVDAAIELLRGLVAKDPSAVEPSVLLAETLIAGERFDEAEEAVAAALTKHPSDTGLERLRGDLLYREGRIFDADKAYKAAIKTDPKNARALYGISRVFEASCLRKKAFEMLRVAHAIDYHDPRIANAFYSVDRRSPAAIARMETELAHQQDAADGKADQSLLRVLKLWISEAKALDGKPEFEVASAGQQYRIPLGRAMDGRRLTGATLPIRINDAKTDLRFDTGAGGITLGSRFAARAGIQRLADTDITGIGNGASVKGWVGYAPSIRIGTLEFRNCIVEVPEKSSVDDSGGLIGSDIFRRFLTKINWTGQSLDLDPLPGPAWDGHTLVDRYEGPELAGYSQMLNIYHYLLIPTLISESTTAEQTPALFLFDTGSNTNMISTNLAPEITRVHGSDVQVRGISGKVKMVYDADKVVVQFATFRQKIRDITSFDLRGFSRGAGAEVGGIMGLPLIGMFESVTLDYRDGRIKFDYKP